MKHQKEELDKDTTFIQNLKERMDEIISTLDKTKELLKDFDEGLFDTFVVRVMVISPAHFKFELKSGIVVEEC